MRKIWPTGIAAPSKSLESQSETEAQADHLGSEPAASRIFERKIMNEETTLPQTSEAPDTEPIELKPEHTADNGSAPQESLDATAGEAASTEA